MKSKTILGADGTTEMREITVGIHGKGGEVGIRAVQRIANAVLIAALWTKREQTSLCA